MENRVWYLADTHFGHANVIKYDQRPFHDVEQMYQHILAKTLERVKPSDTLVTVGDLSFKVAWHNRFASEAPGRKIFVYGNHDWEFDRKKAFQSELWDKCTPLLRFKDMNRHAVVSHYPLEIWDSVNAPAYHVYGHVHFGTLLAESGRYNAFCGLADWGPITLDQMIEAQEPYLQ